MFQITNLIQDKASFYSLSSDILQQTFLWETYLWQVSYSKRNGGIM